MIDYNVTPCIYCGLPANTVDHIPPQSDRSRILECDRHKFTFLEVTACPECNSALYARSLWTIEDRKRFIKQWIRERYKKYLKIPDWSDTELKDLPENTKAFIRDGLLTRELTRQRLRW